MKICKVAVLLTCHNRKAKTIECLKSLFKAIQFSKADSSFSVYLVDDGSTDGTAEAVLSNFPEVNVINGSGNLFWAGGMRLAWNTALQSNPDYYLLLNQLVQHLLRSLCE